MYIEAVPNRSSPPAILLRESYRDNGKVRKRTLANLSKWPPALVESFRTLLKGGTAVSRLDDAFDLVRSLPHGHVAAVLGTLRKLGLDRLLDPAPSKKRDRVLAMIVARILNPGSKLATHRPGAGGGDGTRHLGRGAGARSAGRGRPVCVDGLAAGAPRPHRAQLSQAPS